MELSPKHFLKNIKIDSAMESQSIPSTSTFTAPDMSALIFNPDPDTRKKSRARKIFEYSGAERRLPSKKGKKKHETEISNRFQVLSDLEDDDSALSDALVSSEAAMPVSTKRPPPIHVFYCDYIQTKKNILAAVPVGKDTTFKVLVNNLVVRAANIADYTRITEYLKIQKIQFFTFNASPTKPRKALIKHLPSDTDKDEILSDLAKMGIPAIRVSNFIGRDRKPSTMFIVCVDRDNIEKLFNVKRILDFAVKIENLKPLKNVIQCHRCQRLGHASLHCQMQPRCVKCGKNHISTECPLKKSPETKCTCVNCGLEHPASYKGCEAHKLAMAAKEKMKGARITPSSTGRSAGPSAPTFDRKNFPPLKGTATANRPTFNAWTGSPGTPPVDTTKGTGDGSLGGLSDLLGSIKEITSFFSQIREIFKNINLPELLSNIKDLLMTVSAMFPNGK